MMRELILSIISAFVIEPMEAELKQSLTAAGAPYAVVSDVKACARAAGPVLVQRASSDWWWATSTGFKIATGMKEPVDVVATYAPDCRAAIQAANAYINKTGQSLSSYRQAMPDV
jgi:hypothetical protein